MAVSVSSMDCRGVEGPSSAYSFTSFGAVCAQTQTAHIRFERLKKIYIESRRLIFQSLSGGDIVKSMAKVKEDEGFFLRVLTNFKNQHYIHLNKEQLEDLDYMVYQLASYNNIQIPNHVCEVRYTPPLYKQIHNDLGATMISPPQNHTQVDHVPSARFIDNGFASSSQFLGSCRVQITPVEEVRQFVPRPTPDVITQEQNKENIDLASQPTNMDGRKLKTYDDAFLKNHSLKRQRSLHSDSRNKNKKRKVGRQRKKSSVVSAPSINMEVNVLIENGVRSYRMWNSKRNRNAKIAEVKKEPSVSDVSPLSTSLLANNIGGNPATSLKQFEQAKTNDSSTYKELRDQVETPKLASRYVPQTDSAESVTIKLESSTGEMTSPQSLFTPQEAPTNISEPASAKMEKEDMMYVAEFDCQEIKSEEPYQVESNVGVSQDPNPWGGIDHLLDGYEDEQKVAIKEERTRRIKEQEKMLASRKLSLVLDLDHTLLNSEKISELNPILQAKLMKMEEQDRQRPQRHLFHIENMGLWTKIRPGVWNFLEKASKLFELHICTMGNKLYATEMAKLLDPTGSLFAGRVMSRGNDDENSVDSLILKSKDLTGVLGMESAVVIIDDCANVWPYNKHSLIVVERYMYFPNSVRQGGLHGASFFEIGRDESATDGSLASSLSVIERIHAKFFSSEKLHRMDVGNLLAYEQRNILAGCRILFSRIIPLEYDNPHNHPLWQTAEKFGAVCTNQIDERVTHVVAHSPGTNKVIWALSTGRYVVQPGWVEASALLYRRAKEQDFAVKK